MRFNGSVHERVECPGTGEGFDIVVIGPDDVNRDDVAFQAHGIGITFSLRFSRAQSRRIGELLIQAADDRVVEVRP
jgi:hypothetical protein